MNMRVRITVLVLLLGAALAAPTHAPARTMAQPYQGDRLAYVANGKLYVGFPGRARQMRGPGTATQPAFSHDGQWLAWIRRRPQLMLGFALPHLWLARADGSAAHMVASIHGVASFQWSPSADVLAVQPMARYGTPPIELVPAQGVVHPLPHRLQGEFLWSPDGRKLAVASMSRTGGAHFYVVSGATVHSYALPGMAPFSPVRLVAGWAWHPLLVGPRRLRVMYR